MIELTVSPNNGSGQPVPSPIITLYILDKNFHECPMEPRIRNQTNFYAASVPFSVATGSPGPFQVYASVMAPGYNPAYVPMTPWDGMASLDIPVTLVSFKRPFTPAPRVWKGNMSGIRVNGLPVAPGMEGTPPGLFFSWFYDDRYDDQWRATIRAQMKAQGYTHWLMSWPDASVTPQRYLELCRELVTDGFFPCVMLASKDFSPHDVPGILATISDVLPLLVGVVPMFCIGWELSLWLSPTQVQDLIDNISPRVMAQPGTLLYVHFQEGYGSFQQPGQFFAAFWNRNVGLLTGVLHQRVLSQTRNQYQFDSGGLYDILIRFAGGSGCSADSGWGVPFDLVALEITAMLQAYSGMSEADGDTWGDTAIQTPAVNGPLGPVSVMGSGNGTTGA